jgi:predicted dehydrogenase
MPATTEPLRLIQVGAGAMGGVWLDVLRQSRDVELVAVVDLDPARARESATVAGLPGAAVFASLPEALDAVAADAVLNATVPEAHAEVSTVALLAGLDVLCEKPVADTLSAALSMTAAAEVTGRLLMVSQSRRYWRNLVALRQQVEQLKPLGFATCSFFRGPRFAGFREAMPYPLLNDMAIHQFDLARDLIGAEPLTVSCQSFNPGWSWFAGDAAAEVDVEFANGIRFLFSGSWCSPGMETSWNGSWRLSGAGGTAVWDGDSEPVAEKAPGEPILGVPGSGPEEIAGPLAEFVAAVRSGSVPSGEVHNNVLSLAMTAAAVRSASTGQRVVIADLLEEAYGEAMAAEQRPELRAALASWPSAHEVLSSTRV